MADYYATFCPVIATAIIILCILATASIIITILYRMKKLKLQEYKVHVDSTIDQDVMKILDMIIADSFEDYKLLYLVPKQEDYITNEREDEIRKDLVERVSHRLSQGALDKLSLVYNPQYIAEVISDKIYIAVMEYVVTTNLPKESEPKLDTSPITM